MWPCNEKSREFELFYEGRKRVVRHTPTGRTVTRRGGEGIGDNCQILLYTSGPNEKKWAVVIEVRWELDLPRARQLGFEWSIQSHRVFREMHGRHFYIGDLYVPPGNESVDWDEETLKIFLIGTLIYMDNEKFRFDLDAYPDWIDCYSPKIPTKFHTTIRARERAT